ncbi:MAG: hypothetical protein IPN76_03345 [Saprospiraceae bacterium]|nr:hypothetical protein [Saprospiraceae bacterium]
MDDIVGNYWTANFVSIKVGDVNGSANPSQFDGDETEGRSFDNALIFNTKDIELVAGQAYAIPFVAHPERLSADEAGILAGFQFTLDFDETMLDFVAVGNEEGSLLKGSDFGLPKSLGTSAITVSWVNESGQILPNTTPVSP